MIAEKLSMTRGGISKIANRLIEKNLLLHIKMTVIKKRFSIN